MATLIVTDRGRGRLRMAVAGGLGFVVLYLIHRLLQGTGPDGGDPASVASYNVEHRGALLASEIALGLGLLAFLLFIAPLGTVLWQAGQETTAAALLAVGAVFVALGLLSSTVETALVAVSDTNQPAAVDALNQVQGRVPNVLATAALATVIALVALRAHLLWRWLGYASILTAVLSGLGYVFSVVGRTPEGQSSAYGIATFIVWMLLVLAALWRAAGKRATRR